MHVFPPFFYVSYVPGDMHVAGHERHRTCVSHSVTSLDIKFCIFSNPFHFLEDFLRIVV